MTKSHKIIFIVVIVIVIIILAYRYFNSSYVKQTERNSGERLAMEYQVVNKCVKCVSDFERELKNINTTGNTPPTSTPNGIIVYPITEYTNILNKLRQCVASK